MKKDNSCKRLPQLEQAVSSGDKPISNLPLWCCLSTHARRIRTAATLIDSHFEVCFASPEATSVTTQVPAIPSNGGQRATSTTKRKREELASSLLTEDPRDHVKGNVSVGRWAERQHLGECLPSVRLHEVDRLHAVVVVHGEGVCGGREAYRHRALLERLHCGFGGRGPRKEAEYA